MPVVLFAQDEPDPVETASMRVGVVALTPTISLTELGVDTNVFRQSDQEDPESDFTFTVSPQSDFWIRTGRGLLSLNGTLEFVYFNKFESERSVNGSGSVEYEYPFNRVRPFGSFSGLNTRQRPGFEVDVRARRFEATSRLGFDVRVGSKSFVELAGRRQDVSYAAAEVFNGQALRQSLNRTLEAADLTWRQRLTPLTTWSVRASGERTRFEFSNERNSDSARVETGFDLGQFALIRGSAFVGYLWLTPADGGTLPDYSGPTAEVNVSYTAPFQTRLSLETSRDVDYSFELANPYYVQTGWTVTVTQRVLGPWDFQVLGGRYRLNYAGEPLPSGEDRLDRVDRVGGGIGYTLGQDVRLSFDVQSIERQSEVPGRDYNTLRAGFSGNYGF